MALVEKVGELSGHLFGILLKILFLLGFLVLNYFAHQWMKKFEPAGLLELIEFWAMRVLFAVFTVAPLVIIVCRDLMILLVRSRKKIAAERNKP
jgi:hypothetical protein